jgi:membrane associated rhomboid family serine protease
MAEFRPGGFKTLPTVIKNLIIICALVFLAQQVSQRVFHYPLEYLFALHYWQSSWFKSFQLVTHMFMHGGFWHIAINMFVLWMFGRVLENIWGPKRFLTFYIICGLGAALCFLAVQTIQFHNLPGSDSVGFAMGLNPEHFLRMGNRRMAMFLAEPVLGASGAIFGVLVAFGMMFPNSLIYFYFFIPIKTKWFVIGYIVVELYSGIAENPGDHVAHFAHLGGALFGFILMKIWQNKGIGTRQN